MFSLFKEFRATTLKTESEECFMRKKRNGENDEKKDLKKSSCISSVFIKLELKFSEFKKDEQVKG